MTQIGKSLIISMKIQRKLFMNIETLKRKVPG